MKSFFGANKYYLQNISTIMRGLDESDKKEKYLELQSESRRRVWEYYKIIQEKGVEAKCSFYKEVLEHFGDFDFDFFLMNFFLDSDFLSIFQSLIKNEVFNKHLSDLKTNLAIFLNSFNRKLNDYSSIEKVFFNYLKEEIGIAINSSDNADIWDNTKYNHQEESILYIYSKHLISRVSSEESYWEYTLFGHLLFLKAYNNYDYFNDENKSIKCILMINQLIKSYNDNKSEKNIKLFLLQNKINEDIHRNVFVKYNKTPICISVDKANEISTGFGKKIKEYNELLNIRTVVSDINKASYYDIYKLSDRISVDELNKYLEQKIDTGYFITNQDISKINKEVNLSSKMKNAKTLFFQKFYIFEGLSY